MSNVYNKAIEAAKLVKASDEVKLDILSKYGILADTVYNGADIGILKSNIGLFQSLLADNIINWVLTEKNKPIYKKAVQVNPKLAQVFQSKANVLKIREILVKKLGLEVSEVESYDNIINAIMGFEEEEDIDLEDYVDSEEDNKEEDGDIELEDYTNGNEENEEAEVKEEESVTNNDEVAGYDERIHGGYRRQIEALILNSWKSLYEYHIDGKEIVDGFIVPGGSILGTGETIKYEGVLKLTRSRIDVEPNTMSNAIYEEFVGACKSAGIPMIQTVSDNANEVVPYKYNPLLQRRIASGLINKQAFKGGWSEYSKALAPFISKKTKELALIKSQTGSDEETYRQLSGYIVSLMVVNYKAGLGTQLRICCGDTSKTKQVADNLVARLREREKTHKSIAQGKLVVSDAVVSENGLTAILTVYQNIQGYQSVPQFMGELLCNLQEGMFKPSLKNMIIGLDLENNIVTAPFNGWLLPIIAGSRSGKGVLTLNMLLNVIGTGTPLFYLDGKPDMAALLWKLADKYGAGNSLVVDGVGYEGVTDIDRKPYSAPYADTLKKWKKSKTACPTLSSNFGVMVYLKTMVVLLLSIEYYKTQMNTKYGDVFVVMDEVYKVMITQMEAFIDRINSDINACSKEEKEKKLQLEGIIRWVKNVLGAFTGNDIGVFGNGIKAVALTQPSMIESYKVEGFSKATNFCKRLLLGRPTKLYGRQETNGGKYGVSLGKCTTDSVTYQYYDKYFHFGIGVSTDNTYEGLRTFKPLLVLNENDCMEQTGASQDGAFTSAMLDRVGKYSDVEAFRDKYFRSSKELSDSIGFEGALEQVGRLVGGDWQDLIRQSLSRAYEIADGALRYYGVIGVCGIETVYDYICSFELNHMWTYNEIVDCKDKGVSLEDGAKIEDIEDSGDEEDSNKGNSVFSGFDDTAEDEDDTLDFGENPLEDSNNDIEPEDNAGVLFGGRTEGLSKEEQAIFEDIQNRREEHFQNEEIEEEYGDEDFNIDEEEVIPQDDIPIEEENAVANTVDIPIENTDGEDFDTSGMDFDTPEGVRDEQKFNPEDYETEPEEIYDTEQQVFSTQGKTGKKHVAKPTRTTSALKLTPENSIIAELSDAHPLEKYEKTLLRNLKGANYEFSRRWDAILSAVSKRINSNMVTRVIIVQDEMYVNGRLVSTVNITGGFENIRLEDIVDFKALFKRFRNITELTLDSTMVQRFQIEQPNLPHGFFAYNDKLLKLNILMSNGSKEVIDRNSLTDGQEEPEIVRDSRFRNQFEAICAANNPRLKEQSMGYQSKVWKATKSFGGNSWKAVNNQITKENPSLVKAIGIGTIAIPIVAIGSAIAGIGGLFNMFKRR